MPKVMHCPKLGCCMINHHQTRWNCNQGDLLQDIYSFATPLNMHGSATHEACHCKCTPLKPHCIPDWAAYDSLKAFSL